MNIFKHIIIAYYKMTSKYDFNGGKLLHIPKTFSEGREMYYTNEFLSDESTETFLDGKALLKVDGECTALHRELENDKYAWAFYRRQDNYKGNCITQKLPSGHQLDTYDQGGKSHNYCFLHMPEDYTTGKGTKKSEVGKQTYACITKAVENGNLPDPNKTDCPEWITCEWVGYKHQSNMDGVPYDHALIPHYDDFLPKIDIP